MPQVGTDGGGRHADHCRDFFRRHPVVEQGCDVSLLRRQLPQQVQDLLLLFGEDAQARISGLIDQVARYSLDHGHHVVLDGIFHADHYEAMLAGLAREHLGVSDFYYLDVSLEETLRRHATRPQAAEFGGDEMRGWYCHRDLLGGIRERIIPETSTLQQTTALILAETQLLQNAQRPVPGSGALLGKQEPMPLS